LYFRFIRDYASLDDFKAFVIMVSVKNKCQDAMMRLLENPTSKTSSSENNDLGSALDVASTLASQFMGHQLSDESRENSERDKSQISLFSWAVHCGHVAVVRLLLEKGADVEAKDQDGRTALRGRGTAALREGRQPQGEGSR
jgi:ankyrin repeat protein